MNNRPMTSDNFCLMTTDCSLPSSSTYFTLRSPKGIFLTDLPIRSPEIPPAKASPNLVDKGSSRSILKPTNVPPTAPAPSPVLTPSNILEPIFFS
jgi:hypothetical protein